MKKLLGITCGKGWDKLISPIIDYVYDHDSNYEVPECKIGIQEIKEKFGILDITFVNENNVTPTLRNLQTKAITKSRDVCEFCGSEENVGTTLNNWYKTCCNECWTNKIKTIEPNSVWKPNN